MWHQARTQERKLKGMMTDFKKRAERRKAYYSRLQKLDPFQTLRVQGLKIELLLDPSNREVVESGKNLMPWQGQEDNMLDRFDCRVNLDYIKEEIPLHSLFMRDPEEESKLNFMRYRDIIKATRIGLGQKEHIDTIEFNETNANVWSTGDKEKLKKEREQSAAHKAAIGFSYDGDDKGEVEANKSEEEEEEEEPDILELDMDNPDEITKEGEEVAEKLALQYGVRRYMELLLREKRSREATRHSNNPNAALADPNLSRRDRRKEKARIAKENKVVPSYMRSPLSYARRESPTYEPYAQRVRLESSSRSRSPSPPTKTVEFIREFTVGSQSTQDAGSDMRGEEPSFRPSNNVDTRKKINRTMGKKEEEGEKKMSILEKMKRKRQMALNKTLKQDKAKAEEKASRNEIARLERDEEIRTLQMKITRGRSRSRSTSRSPPRHGSRRRSRSRSGSPRYRRSRSRSRSRTPKRHGRYASSRSPSPRRYSRSPPHRSRSDSRRSRRSPSPHSYRRR